MPSPDYLRYLSKAIRAAGSERKLAAALGLSPPSVNHWMKRGVIPSPQVALKIEELYGIPKECIRPDIFKVPLSETSLTALIDPSDAKKAHRGRP